MDGVSLRVQEQNVDVCHPSIGIEVDRSRMSSSHLIAPPTDPVINLHTVLPLYRLQPSHRRPGRVLTTLRCQAQSLLKVCS
ncbi:hypothetical protein MCEMIEM13_00514 [Comamonadaceae bacterium]